MEQKLLQDGNLQLDIVKDILENLCLYLNELDKLTDLNDINDNYKITLIEQYIADMNDLFMQIVSEGMGDNISVS